LLRGGHDPRELARLSVEARRRKREQLEDSQPLSQRDTRTAGQVTASVERAAPAVITHEAGAGGVSRTSTSSLTETHSRREFSDLKDSRVGVPPISNAGAELAPAENSSRGVFVNVDGSEEDVEYDPVTSMPIRRPAGGPLPSGVELNRRIVDRQNWLEREFPDTDVTGWPLGGRPDYEF
jgi:hypothetical protein